MHKQKLQGVGTSLVAHMVLVSKKSEMEQVCLLSNLVLFAKVQELAQEKMLFWVVSVACCHARNCEVRFPVFF